MDNKEINLSVEQALKRIQRLQESTPINRPYWDKAAKILEEETGEEYSKDRARGVYRRWLKRGSLPASNGKPPKVSSHPKEQTTTEIDGNIAQVSFDTTELPTRALTVDDIKRFAELGDEWVAKKIKTSSWKVYTKDNGHVTNYSIKGDFERVADFDPSALIEKINNIKPVQLSSVPPDVQTGYMLEINIADLHVGKVATLGQTDNEYNIDIARQRYNAAIGKFVSYFNFFDFERVALVVGHDIMQVDNYARTTTRGTHVDSNVDRNEAFNSVVEMATESINKLSGLCPVDVVLVPGNHDENTTFFLGAYLDAYYRNTPFVKVLNKESKKRYYYTFGDVLVMHTHTMRDPKNAPNIMATEKPELWGKSKVREVHMGHRHTQAQYPVKEYQGVVVKEVGSSSGDDKWHYDNEYVGNRKVATAFAWHRKNGLECEMYYNCKE